MPGQLKSEIKQKKRFASLEQEAQLSIDRTAAVLSHDFAEALKPHGITRTQYNVLRILRGAGSLGLCRADIRERLVAQVPDVTRLLDRLEQMRLISRNRDPGDRRLVTTRITERGLKVLGGLDQPVAEIHRKQLGHMSERKLRELIDLLAIARRQS
jgi:MarR family transcriptional regulator, 2-MHQ and catechol-resistance regulon repressor